MILQCSNCAGSVTADDQAIRRGVVACNYCTTFLRVTTTGIETYKEQVLERLPPDNIRVDRNHSGVRIIIPTLTSSNGISRLGQPIGAWVWIPWVAALLTLITVPIVIYLLGNLLIPSGGKGFLTICLSPICLSAGAVFLLLSYIGAEKHPHFFVGGGVLEKPREFFGQNNKLPINKIQQLYVTSNRIRFIDEEPATSFNLFALMDDGKRISVFKKFPSLEAALYVEELLEIEADIFNLPIYGDAQVDAKKVVDFQQQVDEQTVCYACTAPLKITLSTRKKGYIYCEYCQTITLLYTQADHKLILGQPDPNQMVYEVVSKDKLAGVLHKESKEVVLVLKERMIAKAPFNPTVRGKMVSQIGIQQVPISANTNLDAVNVVKDTFNLVKGVVGGKLINQLDEKLAYSEDSTLGNKPINIQEHLAETIKYSMVAQIDNKMHLLIPNIEDFAEGAVIVTTLNNYLETIS